MKASDLLIGLGAAAVALALVERGRRVAESGPATGLRPDGRPGTALITGGSAGIGATFARHLAAQGYDLVLVARGKERLQALAAELSGRHGSAVEILVADLVDQAGIGQVAERIEHLDDLTLVVNNAGFGTTGRFARVDPERQIDMINVHVLASVRLTQAALPGMIARAQGGIINLASLAAFAPLPGGATYSATKAYLVMFSEALDNELQGTGVHVQALCPGFTHTEFHSTPEFSDGDRQGIPGFLWMQADDVVDASLSALRRGEVVCIPGAKNRVLATLMRTPPSSALARFGMRLSLARR